MQALANLTLANWAAQNKTFSAVKPQSTETAGALWAEKSYTFPAAYKMLGFRVSAASAARQTDKVFISLSMPKVQTLNGVETVTSTGQFRCDITVPSNWTDADVQDLVAFSANALGSAAFKTAIVAREPFM